MCCGHQASHQHVLQLLFHSLPSAYISQVQNQVIDWKYISRSPQGTHGSASHSVSRAPNPVPQGSVSCHLIIWQKWEKEKWRGELRQLNVLSFIYLYFNLFCLQDCQSLKLEQQAVWDDCVESRDSLSLVEGKVLPPQEEPYFMDLSCVKSLISQCIEPHIKFHVLLLKSRKKSEPWKGINIQQGEGEGEKDWRFYPSSKEFELYSPSNGESKAIQK